MPGSYCQFCGHRCFVLRRIPGRTDTLHMATCAEGKAHDREQTGHDADTAINPSAVLDRVKDVDPNLVVVDYLSIMARPDH